MRRVIWLLAVLALAPSAASEERCTLTTAQRGNLERCAWGLVSYRVGHRGSFLLHMKTTADFRMIARDDDSQTWWDQTAPVCMAVAHECPSCAWRVTGPYPSWRIAPE